jgi:hypothetical protein
MELAESADDEAEASDEDSDAAEEKGAPPVAAR